MEEMTNIGLYVFVGSAVGERRDTVILLKRLTKLRGIRITDCAGDFPYFHICCNKLFGRPAHSDFYLVLLETETVNIPEIFIYGCIADSVLLRKLKRRIPGADIICQAMIHILSNTPLFRGYISAVSLSSFLDVKCNVMLYPDDAVNLL